MLYNKNNYPGAMKNLPREVRNKALDILNALVAEKNEMDIGHAVATSIKRAKQWAEKIEGEDCFHLHGNKYYVTPYKDGWAIRCDKSSSAAYAYHSKEKALLAAKHLARENHARLEIQKANGSLQESLSYYEGHF
ncbi:MAG: DUF2188 domain-containing protein [Bacteroidales bacterium]|nr:DUF2188 domain-containing protein [Bacteroidales bacterium]